MDVGWGVAHRPVVARDLDGGPDSGESGEVFTDRADAGRRLAAGLASLARANLVVLGLPRGGVPVAAEVAGALGAPLDVIVVRKLGVPSQPELAMGAIGEDGVRLLNEDMIRAAGVTAEEVAAVEAAEREELQRRLQRYREGRPAVPIDGRTALIIDDGIATGATAAAACQVVRARGAARVALAVPVAPVGATAGLTGVADQVVCLVEARDFRGVGQFYDDFAPTSHDEVVKLLAEGIEPGR